jgi:type IV secretion system protein VirB10
MVASMKARSHTGYAASAVFNRPVQPRVRQPSSPWTMALGIGGAGVLGLFVFSSLSGDRSAHAQTAPATATAPALRGQQGPTPPSPSPVASAAAGVAPPALATQMPLPAQPNAGDANLRAPAVVVDLADSGAAAAPGLRAPGAQGEDGKVSPEERFAARVTASSADTVRATQMRDVGRLVPQGAMIPAVLETAIDSDLPGSVRAVVSRDVRGFDGSQVLIPRGSKLIGQYKSAAAVGQTRAFVVWSRLITPTGVSVDIGSPATDQLGRGGLAGETDSHFFRRFGASIMLSVISAGLEAVAHAGSNNTNTALIIGSPAQASHMADIALQKQIDIPTTIRVKPGASVQVFVARDLDFSGVATPAP